jgi:hypothetical protein
MVKKVVLRAIAAFYTLNLQQISTFSPLLANLIVVEDPHEPDQIRNEKRKHRNSGPQLDLWLELQRLSLEMTNASPVRKP